MTLCLATDEGLTLLEDDGADSPLIAVLPGDDIALHRLALLETDPAARLIEARMRATDLSAQPIEDVHVAVGPADSEGSSWVALIDRERMASHLSHATVDGKAPAAMVPAALLLPPAESSPSLARLGDRVLLRTHDLAALVEPPLASSLTGTSLMGRFITLGEFKPGTPASLPLDLLQGDFAPRLKWWALRWVRLGALGLGLLVALLLFAPILIREARNAAAVAAYDHAVVELANQTLGKPHATAERAARALAIERRNAEGPALAAKLTSVSRAIEQTMGAELESATLQPDGKLELKLGGSAEAIRMLSAKLEGGPFDTKAHGTNVIMGDRVAGRAANPTKLANSMVRMVTARQDAALVMAARARKSRISPAQAAALFTSAGLSQTMAVGSSVEIPSARPTALFPLLADLDQGGARIEAASFTRNADNTISARLSFAS